MSLFNLRIIQFYIFIFTAFIFAFLFLKLCDFNVFVFVSRTTFAGNKYIPEIFENVYKVVMKLTIVSVDISDFDTYKCVAKNSLGETDGSIKLYRKYLNFLILFLYLFFFILFCLRFKSIFITFCLVYFNSVQCSFS